MSKILVQIREREFTYNHIFTDETGLLNTQKETERLGKIYSHTDMNIKSIIIAANFRPTIIAGEIALNACKY